MSCKPPTMSIYSTSRGKIDDNSPPIEELFVIFSCGSHEEHELCNFWGALDITRLTVWFMHSWSQAEVEVIFLLFDCCAAEQLDCVLGRLPCRRRWQSEVSEVVLEEINESWVKPSTLLPDACPANHFTSVYLGYGVFCNVLRCVLNSLRITESAWTVGWTGKQINKRIKCMHMSAGLPLLGVI